MAQTVKRLLAVRETGVQSLGWEDALEKEMAIHSSTSTIAWKIPWTRGLVGYSSWGHKEWDTTERLHFHFLFIAIYKIDKVDKRHLRLYCKC